MRDLVVILGVIFIDEFNGEIKENTLIYGDEGVWMGNVMGIGYVIWCEGCARAMIMGCEGGWERWRDK